jgi:hypothetical protein
MRLGTNVSKDLRVTATIVGNGTWQCRTLTVGRPFVDLKEAQDDSRLKYIPASDR